MRRVLPDWSRLYSRRYVMDTAEAYVGVGEIVIISRPFTPAEDAAISWALQQDSATLLESMPLPDGRDLMYLRREFERQSEHEATWEHLNRLYAMAAGD